MKQGKTRKIELKRKRQGKTNYRKRLKMLLSNKPRFVIRKSLRNIHASIVDYDAKGDKVLASAHSKELEKLGWGLSKSNLSSAYLVGFLLGKRAKRKGIKNAVLDLGLNKSVKGSRLYAALSGALDGGLEVPHNPKVLPSKERISGSHIAKYASQLKNEEGALKKQFGGYLNKNVNPENFVDYFNKIKNKIEEDDDGKARDR